MKRKYTKPVVESEEALEQTSLQCNASYFPMEDACEWGQNAWPGTELCTVDVSKGGVFLEPCSQIIPVEWNCVVALS